VWRLRGALPAGTAVPLLPDVAGADIALMLGAPGRLLREGEVLTLPPRFVVGGLGRALQLVPEGPVDVVGLHLPPGCACLLGTSAAAMRERVVALAEVAPALDAALTRWAQEGAAQEGLWALLAAHLTPRCDGLVCRAAQALAQEGRGVAQVAGALGVSRRQLTRRFTEAVGVTPRDFVRFARFSRAWRAAAMEPGASWAALAAEAGYADQPHLDRDFRSLAGAPPSRVFSGGPPVEATVGPHAMSPPSKSRGAQRR
jgi:AraC-like DNA-binding protein